MDITTLIQSTLLDITLEIIMDIMADIYEVMDVKMGMDPEFLVLKLHLIFCDKAFLHTKKYIKIDKFDIWVKSF